MQKRSGQPLSSWLCFPHCLQVNTTSQMQWAACWLASPAITLACGMHAGGPRRETDSVARVGDLLYSCGMTTPKISRPTFPKGYVDNPVSYVDWDWVAEQLTDYKKYRLC